MTLSGRFRIRCCTLPRRADLDRQIINCEERRQPASFRLLGRFETFRGQWPRRAVSEPITTTTSLGQASFQDVPELQCAPARARPPFRPFWNSSVPLF